MRPGALPLTYALLRMLKKLLDKLNIALLKLFKTAFDDHTSLVNQSQAASDRFGAIQIVSHHNRRHPMFRLQLENQVVNLRGTDRIETGGGFVEQKNVRLQSQCASKTDAFLHAA